MAHHHHSIGVRKNLLRNHADDDISQNLATWFDGEKIYSEEVLFFILGLKHQNTNVFGCLMWFKVSWL